MTASAARRLGLGPRDRDRRRDARCSSSSAGSIVQGTRAQLAWRKRVEAGDVDAIRTLVGDEVERWKTMRMPKGVDASVWHGVQSAELLGCHAGRRPPQRIGRGPVRARRRRAPRGQQRRSAQGWRVTAQAGRDGAVRYPEREADHRADRHLQHLPRRRAARRSAASSSTTVRARRRRTSSTGTSSTPRTSCARSAAASRSTIAATRCRSTPMRPARPACPAAFYKDD